MVRHTRNLAGIAALLAAAMVVGGVVGHATRAAPGAPAAPPATAPVPAAAAPGAPAAPAAPGAPAAGPLKSQIIPWDDARANVADWGEMRRYFTGQTGATQNVLVAVAVVKPGMAVHKAHRHAEEEYLALVEGTGVWSLDGKEFPAKRGDILYAEPWVYHGLTNTGETPLTFIVVRYNGKGVDVPPQPDERPNEK
ncbi:MAG: cupin domain-containing protein [Planctomycetes bacterium]|nr:cupin domain-containing protein [Planctomycetota bacterium]